MKKKIYIAYTGGTIGMQRSQHGYIPQPGFMADCLAGMPEFHRAEMPGYHIHEYEPLIDSSDMTPADWQRIAEDIRDHYDDYDGFVVLHGTDTMSFTASALSFMLEGLGKPVIITGSQIPLAELRSDGQQNLLNALFLAANYPIHEVALFFNNQLFRGNRSTKVHADGFHAFDSPNFPPLLEAGIQIQLVAGQLGSTGDSQLRLHGVTPQPIGVVTLAERHPEPAGALNGALETWYEAMVADMSAAIAGGPADPALRPLFEQGRAHMVGTSGAITSLAGIHLGLRRYQRNLVDGLWMTRSDCEDAADRLKAMGHAGRAAESCIGPDRADLVLAGAAIMEAVQRAWPSERVRVADRGLREGLLLQRMREDRKPKRRRRRRGRGNGAGRNGA